MNFKQLKTTAFFAIFITVGLILMWMFRPFLYPIFWAMVLGTLFYPLYKKFLHWFRFPGLASALSIVVISLVFLIPLSIASTLVVQQAIGIYTTINDPKSIDWATEQIKSGIEIASANKYLDRIDLKSRLEDAAGLASQIGFGVIQRGWQTLVGAVLSTLITLYTLFYFFTDGKKWLAKISGLFPLESSQEQQFINQFRSIAKATMKGSVLVGVAQGIFGGLIFWAAGIPSPAFWGMIMVLVAILPAVGTNLILIPGAIYLYVFTGDVGSVAIVLAGSIAAGLIDNLVRPMLIGKDASMHPLLMFFSTLGGLSVFGLSGVIIGPLIAGFFQVILDLYGSMYRKQLKSK